MKKPKVKFISDNENTRFYLKLYGIILKMCYIILNEMSSMQLIREVII
jgi:hypothetical protein